MTVATVKHLVQNQILGTITSVLASYPSLYLIDFACAEPITLAFARGLGHVLAEVSPDARTQAEYRFYITAAA
jgi:hypothetical protein